MADERIATKRVQYARALARLRQAAGVPETELVRDAAIQRFEFTFELAWKVLRLELEPRGFECGSPRGCIRQAFALGWLGDAAAGDGWLKMIEDRNLASHIYDEAMAAAIYRRIVADSLPLLVALNDRLREGFGD